MAFLRFVLFASDSYLAVSPGKVGSMMTGRCEAEERLTRETTTEEEGGSTERLRHFIDDLNGGLKEERSDRQSL